MVFRMLRTCFVCIGNSCRSQMAEGFSRHHASDVMAPMSGGTAPEDEVSPFAVSVMREKGIDISGAVPKKATEDMLRSCDLIVHMGCGSEGSCPFFPGIRTENWGIEDPKGRGMEAYREARDIIEAKVLDLASRVRTGRLIR